MVPPLENGELAELRAVFDRDSARLFELLADVRFLCGRKSYLAAARVFAEFRMHEEQHISREEALLEKLVRSGRVAPGVAARTVDEHRALHERIGRTWAALSRNEGPAFDRELAALSEALAEHERSEKDEILPALGLLTDARQVAKEVHQIVDD
jgi:hypothetical protein